MRSVQLFCHIIILSILSSTATAHEFWIEPKDYTVDSSGTVLANFSNGQLFNGVSESFIPNWLVTSKVANTNGVTEIKGQLGQRPAMKVSNLPDGLNVLMVQKKPLPLNYTIWEKFEKFAKHKDFGISKADHLALGYPEKNFIESYSRYTKALVGVGHAKGQDKRQGMEIELVALANPYTDNTSAGLPVQAFYQGKPRKNVQIELFDRAVNGTVTVSLLRTNSNGIVNIPVKSGHNYLVDTVVLRKPAKGAVAGAVWETLWASLTFAKE